MVKNKVKIKDQATAQALSEFLYKEISRHIEDIIQILIDLEDLKKKRGVKPSGKFLDKWLIP